MHHTLTWSRHKGDTERHNMSILINTVKRYRFLCDWNGVSLFYDNALTCSADMELYTDASLVGFGAIFRQQWFSSAWPKEIPSVENGDLSMVFRELYPIVAAAVLWGKHWTAKRIIFVCDNLSAVYILQKSVPNVWPL